MSKSLVKKALELFKEDDEELAGVKPQAKSKKTKQAGKKEEFFLKKGKKSKDLIESHRSRVNKKETLKANLKYLKLVSKPMVQYDLIRSIIEKKKTNSGPTSVKDKKSKRKTADNEAGESVFSEKDFMDFQKSYFGVNK